MDRIADDIWHWTARHPEWHPRGTFGARVGAYAMHAGEDTLIIDPIAPGGDVDALLDRLDEIVSGTVTIAITIPYHVRDAELVWLRYRAAHGAKIRGHPAVAKRLANAGGFRPVVAGEAFGAGILPIAIGNPRRHEMPLFVPEHRALVFGDAIVEAEGAARVWMQRPITPERLDWYEHRLRPSLKPLLDIDCERLLVTHGTPLLSGGREALEQAFETGPWFHPPG